MKNEIRQLEYCNKAIDLKGRLENSFLELGQMLYEIKWNELWISNWGSWDEFTWELKMSPNTINKLIQIYKTLVVGYGFNHQQIANAGGWSVVAEVLPLITSKKEAVKWLTTASELTRSDLRKTINEAKTGIDMRLCAHDHTRRIVLEICNSCGEKHEVFEGEVGWSKNHIHNSYGNAGGGFAPIVNSKISGTVNSSPGSALSYDGSFVVNKFSPDSLFVPGELVEDVERITNSPHIHLHEGSLNIEKNERWSEIKALGITDYYRALNEEYQKEKEPSNREIDVFKTAEKLAEKKEQSDSSMEYLKENLLEEIRKYKKKNDKQ